MKIKQKGMIEIHAAVLLFGLAGLFGKFLSLSPFVIVFGRTFFASLWLGIYLVLSQKKIRPESWNHAGAFILLGIILTAHWISFFHSIQVSTVAVGLLSFSTFPLFVTFIEPYFFNENLRFFDVLTAILVLSGLILVIPSFDFGNKITQGVFWGIISGLTFAVLSLLNRKYVAIYSPLVMAWYQNIIAALILSPFMFFIKPEMRMQDIILLTVLGIFCTALAHGLFIKSLIHVKAQLASIIAGLEPVYGIFFAFLFLGEIPGLRTILGGIIILGTITLAAIKRHQN